MAGRYFEVQAGMTGGVVLSGILGLTLVLSTQEPTQQRQDQPATPRFRSSVELVSVAAVVRDKKGRFVTDLSQKDFEIVEAGKRRPILDFRSEINGPVKLAVLVDISGSMRMGKRSEDARHAARHIFSNLSGTDQAGVFSFDTMLSEVQSFTDDRTKLDAALTGVEPPFGQTSLYDAIASTARLLAGASTKGPLGLPQRSAVVVITDGVDTRSRMQPGEVSAIASSIDVPVYIIAVVATVDDPREHDTDRNVTAASNLEELSRRTGGDLLITSTPAQASTAARQVLGELRHQYLLAFEATSRAGWRPLEIRTRHTNLVVRARSGYGGGDASEMDSGAAAAAVSGPASVRRVPDVLNRRQ
jgi:Ca-activated chloride channel family protein